MTFVFDGLCWKKVVIKEECSMSNNPKTLKKLNPDLAKLLCVIGRVGEVFWGNREDESFRSIHVQKL